MRIFFLLFLSSVYCLAQENITGRWKSFSDKTGKLQSIVQIDEVNGELKGTIVKIFPEVGEDPNPKCDKCPDDFKNKPILGLGFLWGFKKEGKTYSSGKILDPEEGGIYRCRLELDEGGKKLNVRGYIGIPLLGRTQIWQRDESVSD